jgi:hypothetical protein
MLWQKRRKRDVRRSKSSRAAFCPRLDGLEARWLPAPLILTVTTTEDNGSDTHPTSGSLRAAILAANANTGFTNTIDFNISFKGGFYPPIYPPTLLPTITNPVVIDGYSQPGASPSTSVTNHNANIPTRSLTTPAWESTWATTASPKTLQEAHTPAQTGFRASR